MTQYEKDLFDAIASVQHEIWSCWMRYMLSMCRNTDGTYTMSPDQILRWSRQINTEYENLSVEEQKYDQEQAEKIFTVLRDFGYV